MSLGVLFLIVVLTALLMTAALRRYALARSLVDIPNARSSHALPTPRGGGVAFVITFLVVLICLRLMSAVDIALMVALIGAGGLVAVLGFMDDHGHIAARWRLLGHFSAAGWALFWLDGMPTLNLFGMSIGPAWYGVMFGLLYCVWMLNLYNFMDGIDGLASAEAICVCAGGCLLYLLSGHVSAMWPPLMLAAAVAGFLFWNFPPARIFMGDAGSGFLGIVLAVLSLRAASIDPQLFWGWAILLGVFIVDATFTLGRRLLRGEKLYQAHRSHAYQFASRHYGSHLPVTLVVVAINLFWLLPIAVAVVWFKWDGLGATAIAYLPLLVLAIRFHAGELENHGHVS